jgi:hypothetical protein
LVHDTVVMPFFYHEVGSLKIVIVLWLHSRRCPKVMVILRCYGGLSTSPVRLTLVGGTMPPTTLLMWICMDLIGLSQVCTSMATCGLLGAYVLVVLDGSGLVV